MLLPDAPPACVRDPCMCAQGVVAPSSKGGLGSKGNDGAVPAPLYTHRNTGPNFGRLSQPNSVVVHVEGLRVGVGRRQSHDSRTLSSPPIRASSSPLTHAVARGVGGGGRPASREPAWFPPVLAGARGGGWRPPGQRHHHSRSMSLELPGGRGGVAGRYGGLHPHNTRSRLASATGPQERGGGHSGGVQGAEGGEQGGGDEEEVDGSGEGGAGWHAHLSRSHSSGHV